MYFKPQSVIFSVIQERKEKNRNSHLRADSSACTICCRTSNSADLILIMSTDGLPPLLPHHTIRSPQAAYQLIRKVGQGSFGELWLATMDGKDRKGKPVTRNVAIKFESQKSPTPSIHLEVTAYIKLGVHKTVPLIFDTFPFAGRSCMAMELLGKSIENRRDWSSGKMAIKDVIQIGVQVLEAVQHLHECKLIHRDIKPDNFLFGPQGSRTQDQLRIIDLGLSKPYIDKDTGKHIEFNANSMPMGTARYMSIRAHMGLQQSRRDDLEAVSYMLLYLLRGRMPWDGVKETDPKKKNAATMSIKQSTPIHQLIGNEIPVIFSQLLEYSKKLKFKEDPDYDKMRAILTGYAKQAKIPLDGKFSWSNVVDDSEISIKPQINSNAKIKNRSNK